MLVSGMDSVGGLRCVLSVGGFSMLKNVNYFILGVV